MGDETTGSLTPESWIMAGFRALAAGGPAAIKVEALAREIGATKGSFYWHFKDAAALKGAMLAAWKQAATEEVIAATAQQDDAESRLMALMAMAAAEPGPQWAGRLAEPAIRDWARYEPAVKAFVETIDRQREAYVAQLFQELGADEARARTLGALLYAAYVGRSHMDRLAGEAGAELADFAGALIKSVQAGLSPQTGQLP
ncbi:TetR/AcrR family transcriptional regulator [Oryzibacter oryziterrae]|uniref:TetR/AcrR family transcriptional regulator n=1 Tax=Oryzibacter oryziterrae TaxID=2766474 RepID=UPI001F2C1B12|nr:TetR/AcrR family transcriptional regulator [Oryzibacter oryziterrae]